MGLLLDENQVGIVAPDGAITQYSKFLCSDRSTAAMGEMKSERMDRGTSVGFPNLITCQGVVAVMANGSMIGSHVPSAQDEELLMQKMNELIELNGGSENIQQLYVSYNPKERRDEHGTDIKGKAQMLGFSGEAKFIDTSKLGLRSEGAYVKVNSLNRPDGKCLVDYKRDSKMDYTNSTTKLTDDIGRERTKVVKVGESFKPGATKMHHTSGKRINV
jgi:hypothetical protein